MFIGADVTFNVRVAFSILVASAKRYGDIERSDGQHAKICHNKQLEVMVTIRPPAYIFRIYIL